MMLFSKPQASPQIAVSFSSRRNARKHGRIFTHSELMVFKFSSNSNTNNHNNTNHNDNNNNKILMANTMTLSNVGINEVTKVDGSI